MAIGGEDRQGGGGLRTHVGETAQRRVPRLLRPVRCQADTSGAKLNCFPPKPICLKHREDDLFRESTMTFGQHLEELRACLFKAIGGLLIGFIIGLCGRRLRRQVHSAAALQCLDPLLREGVGRASQQPSWRNSRRRARRVPWTKEQVEGVRRKETACYADEFYVDPAQILQELKEAYPKQFKNVELPPPTKPSDESDAKAASDKPEGLVRVFLWHHSENDPRLQTKSLAMSEPFSIYIKASLLVGVLLASPWIFYQIWHFVAAGLYPHERRYVHRYLPFSLGLFLLGAALAFFVVFEPVLNFLLSFNRSQGIVPELRINEWLGFVLILPVGFWDRLPVAAGDAVFGADRRVHGAGLPEAVARRGAGDLRAGGHSDAARSLQHVVDGVSADVPLLRRHSAVQAAAASVEPVRRIGDSVAQPQTRHHHGADSCLGLASGVDCSSDASLSVLR